MYVHLSEAAVLGDDPVAHLERGSALVTAEQVRIAEQVAVRDHTCAFPWCCRPARRCRPDDHGCDDDHVRPRAGGGATCACNLAPLCRRHHRLKTHSPWSYVVLDPGTYLWTTPHGYQFLRDDSGTLDVSRDRLRPVPSPPVPTSAGHT